MPNFAKLRARRDGRLWVLGGTTFGTFTGFVEHVLPDLHDEQVMGKIMETHRTLGNELAPAAHSGGENAK